MATGNRKRDSSIRRHVILAHENEDLWQPTEGKLRLNEISTYIEDHLGPVDSMLHGQISDDCPLAIYIVKPGPDFPYLRLITSGISDLPIEVPKCINFAPDVELMITLPDNWRINQDSFKDDNWYWPLRLLLRLARLPHNHGTWLDYGDTFSHEHPAQPFADSTGLCGAILLSTPSAPRFGTLRVDKKREINFLSVVPLYEEEINLTSHRGVDRLLQKFSQALIGEVIDPNRRNAAIQPCD